jgi:hypothetical protein
LHPARAILSLSKEQLRELGWLSFNFAAMEEAIAAFIAAMYSIGSGTGAFDKILLEIAAKKPFEKKVKIAKKILDAVLSQESHQAVNADAVSKLLTSAPNLAEERNDFIHGWIEWHSKRGVIFNNKARGRNRRAAEIRGLNGKLVKWLAEFMAEFTSLLTGI